ncbi:MAG: hypothetical protein QOH06_449 [Acidobacteriota bacterium]|nr:hypothetical protein [Acidobacteriota bacterium]
MSIPLDFDWPAEKERIRNAVARIWQQPVHRFYTDHGTSHSERVFQFCEALRPVWDLSGDELDVLWTCAYIHDVGMQFSDWGRYRVRGSSKTIARALNERVTDDPNWIRERHCDLGFKLINAELAGQRSWEAPLSFASSTTGHAASFLWNCAKVAFAHSKGTLWEEMRVKPPKDAKHPSGKRIRTTLLVGAFRLADELDGCKQRIPEMSRILHSSMPASSIAHWLACWFVEELAVKADEEAIEITVNWQVPTTASEEEVAEIRELLKIFRRKRLRQVADEMATFFSRSSKDALHRAFAIKGLEDGDEPERIPFPDWPKMRPALQRTLKEAGWRAPRPNQVGRSGRVRAGLSVARVKDALINWTLSDEGFRRGRHCILERGLHTDAFVNCRALGSDQDLVAGVCDWLDQEVGPIDLCVAVGTSMIPFALEFARRRKANLTFTFANPTLRFGDTKVDRFAEIESAPLVSEGCKAILVLDDIIAVGEGARSVITELRSGPDMADCKVWHYSLFRLGRQEFYRLPDVKYDWLSWVKDVHYWEEGRCPICARKPSELPLREADIVL